MLDGSLDQTAPRRQTLLAWMFTRGPRQDVAVTLASQLLLLVCGLGTGVVTARVLGPSGRGQLALALLVPSLLVLLFGLGSIVANVYFVGSGRLGVSEASSNSVAFALISTAAGALLLLVLHATGLLRLALPGVPAGNVAAAFLVLPAALFAGSLTGIIRGLQMLRTAAVLDMVQAIVGLGGVMIALLALHTGVQGAIVAAATSTASSAVGALIVLRPRGLSLRPRLRRDVSLPVLRFGLRGDLANITQFFSYRLDSFIVNALLSAAAVGVYAVATRLAELLLLLPTAVSAVVFPRAAAADHAHLNRSTPRVFGRTIVLVTVGAAGLAATGGLILRILYGSAFSSGLTPLLLLLPGIVLLGGASVLTNEVTGRGHPGYNTLNSATGLAVTVALDLLLIPAHGISGAAIASTVAYAVNAVLAVVFYRRVSGTPLKEFVRAAQWWRA